MLLGRGLRRRSFGEVWVAKEKHSCMLVAIKKVKEKGNVKAIEKEANSLRSSISSFIVRYHDVIKKGNEVWVANCRLGNDVDCDGILPLRFCGQLHAERQSADGGADS